MGQAEVIEFLQKHPHLWFTSKEICQKLDASNSSVLLALKKLIQQGYVERRPEPDERYGFQYRFRS